MTVIEHFTNLLTDETITFKQYNKELKEHKDYLNYDYDYYMLYKECFDPTTTMNALSEACKKAFAYTKASNIMNPKYLSKNYENTIIEDPTLKPVYNAKYKSVIITRR